MEDFKKEPRPYDNELNNSWKDIFKDHPINRMVSEHIKDMNNKLELAVWRIAKKEWGVKSRKALMSLLDSGEVYGLDGSIRRKGFNTAIKGEIEVSPGKTEIKVWIIKLEEEKG